MDGKSKGSADGYQSVDNEEESSLLGGNGIRDITVAEKYNRISAALVFLFPATGGLLFGYDIGATSAVITQLQSSAYSGTLWYESVAQSSILQGIITSVMMLGAMFGSMTCFSVADYLGRRRSLLLASFLFFAGGIIEYISGNPSFDARTGISVLILGRLTYGYGCGFAMHGAPAYIGEMAPPAIRGLLVSLKEAFIVLGMVFGYTIGYSYASTVGGWRVVYVWACPMAAVMFCGMMYLPYSARWLALKGRINEARQSLKWVMPNFPESEVEAIRESAEKAAESQSDTNWSADYQRLTAPAILPALVAGVGLVFLQQVTGQPSVLYYADSIFVDIGLSTVASIGVSGFKLIATLFATFTVDNYGRKMLLYIGCSLMLIALLILGTAFLFPYTSAEDCYSYTSEATCISTCSWQTTCDDDCFSSGYDDSNCYCCNVAGINSQKAVILTALFIYIGGYQVGFGPISWLLISEIFPLEVRGKAVSIAVVTNFFWNTVMTFFFPVELDLIGTSATFYMYALILAFGIYFIFYRVPETKGLSLEEIEEYFLRTSKMAARAENIGSDKGKDGNYKLSPAI